MRKPFLAVLILATGCLVPRPESAGSALPGLPVAARHGAAGPRHVQRVVEVRPDAVVLDEEIVSDGRAPVASRLVVARDGRVETRTPRTGPPGPPAPGASPIPVRLGDLVLRAERSSGAWTVRLSSPGAPPSQVATLATVPHARTVKVGEVHLSPDDPPSLAALAWTSRTGDIEVEGVTVLDLRRGRARVALLRGLDAHRESRFEAAARDFEAALAIDPTYADAAYDLAAAYARLGDPARALTFLDRAFELEPVRLRVAVAVDPDFDSLRTLPAFQELVGPGAELPKN